MTITNDEEQIIVVPLGKALQNARVRASLTDKNVAEQLNLSVSTIRDIEDCLDDVIENEKYPSIYLRGYIANYAKLVMLDNPKQFIEYQQLIESQTRPQKLYSESVPNPLKKWAKRVLLGVVLLIAVIVVLLIGQSLFFSESDVITSDIKALSSDTTTATGITTKTVEIPL